MDVSVHPPPVPSIRAEVASVSTGHRLRGITTRQNYWHKGYRYPWESAYTGIEVTQPCCPDVAEYEQHISGCIAFAARQYLATTRNEDWLKHGGCSLVTHIADFWASRAVINYTTGLYDIGNVMGPDEDHRNITNSVFTNVVAGYSLYLAQYVACLCKSYFLAKDPESWADIAWSLALPYDEELDYHPQFSGYSRGEQIKQADAVLLGFPLQYPMNTSTRANDLSYYEGVTRGSGPAMTWSMHTVGHLQLGDTGQANAMFNKSYEDYVREPFKVWSELRRPKIGAANFFTGMGGFLQALVFGYGGIRIHLDHLLIDKPQLPPDTSGFTIRGLKYLGANLTLDIQETQSTLSVAAVDDNWPLTYHDGRNQIRLAAGVSNLSSDEDQFEEEEWQEMETNGATASMKSIVDVGTTSSSLSEPAMIVDCVSKVPLEEDEGYFNTYAHFGIHYDMLSDKS
ncbi:hypothetical protein MSG28_002482 [Choristoneura fumiferana]|uniref:Uncharacterized protein n=1 Tax=Choristoneura fumiferana TaxID=7141 RepID=A0ACC0JW06_CHOFU|nr:hypothetical protein MSG28_002482 [Choristoneura fumiferana]